jgi:predicted GNAT family N-acyltransferase
MRLTTLWQALVRARPSPTGSVRVAMSDGVTYEVRRVGSRAEMDAALRLRHDVFCVEQGVPVREELDGRDDDAIHLVAVGGGELVATCRLLFVGPTVQFSRLAVHPSARRQGIATALLELADVETRAGGARRIVLHAQTYARALYEAAGYEPRGRLFMEAGIEHVAMEKQLP